MQGKYVDVRKNRYDGSVGSIQVNFDRESKNFVEEGSELPLLEHGQTLSKSEQKNDVQEEMPVATDLGSALHDITEALLQFDSKPNDRNQDHSQGGKQQTGFWEQSIIEH